MNIVIALVAALVIIILVGIMLGVGVGVVTLFERYPKGVIDFFVRCPECSGRKTILFMTYHYEDREHGDKDAWDGLCCHCGKIHAGIEPSRWR